jgi:hypothetical protein
MRQHEEARTCKTCSKVFAYTRGLVRHGSVHTGARPHMCLTCHKTFAQKGTLTTHMKVHATKMVFKGSGGGSGNAPREHPFARALLSLKKIGEEQWRLARSGGGSGGGEKDRYDATIKED